MFTSLSQLPVTENINFDTVDIEKLFHELYMKWDKKKEEDYTEEEKKDTICKRFTKYKQIKNDIRDYMLTDSYKEIYAELKNKAIQENLSIDPESIFKKRRQVRYIGLNMVFNDEEKIALGIRGISHRRKKEENVEKYMPKGEFIKGTDYILFAFENGGFATRYILVPVEEFTKFYFDILDMLRKNATTAMTADTVVNTLITVYDGKNLDSRGCGCMESVKNEFDEFVGGMMIYAECNKHMGVHYGHLKEGVSMDENRTWYIKSICNGYGYFNPESGKNALIEEALEKGCTVSEAFVFVERYINNKRGSQIEYKYETPAELTQAIVNGTL